MSPRQLHGRNQSDDESYFVSMTDIMVGLLFVFIIIIMYFAFQLKAQTEAQVNYADTATNHLTQILEDIKEHMQDQGVLNVVIDTEHGILRLPEGVLFDQGVFEIQPYSKPESVIKKLSNAFASILKCSVFNHDGKIYDISEHCKEKNPDKVFIETIFIEGHTDNVSISESGLRGDSQLNSNLRLSARRATNTFDKMIEAENLLNDFASPDNQALFSISAYGEQRPIASNDNEVGRAGNRRIDIRILMKVPNTPAALEKYQQQVEEALAK